MTTGESSSKIGGTSSESFSVLVTGAGSPGAVGIIKCLKSLCFVIGVDINPFASGFKFCDAFFIVPPADHKDFIPRMLEICGQAKINLVLPKVTAELEKLAKAKEDFKKIGTEILISDKPLISIANNKYKLFNKLKGIIPVPEFFLAEDGFCIKPEKGSGGDGFKKYDGSGVVMEYLPGDEFSVDVLADKGEPKTICVRVRETVKAGVSMEGVVIKDKEIEDYTAKAVRKLKLHGIVGFQFKRNKKGIPVLLECNPRIQGTIILSERAGAKILYNAVGMAKDGTFEEPQIIDGTKMIRYLQEFYG